MMLKRTVLFIVLPTVLIVFAPSDSFGKSEESIVNKANKLYNEGKYDEALKGYNEAEEISPESGVVNFNKGAALYKKYGYEKALGRFSKVLSIHNPGLESKATYNIGNTKYKLGKSLEAEKQGTTTRLYKEALEYYKRTIELNQEDQDAKFNYEFVEKELKALQDKKEERQQNQQQDQQQDQQQKDKQQQSQEGQDKREERQKQKEQEEEEASDKEEKEERSEEEPQEGQMSEQEASMLLDAYGQQEEPETKLKKHKAQYEVLKDW
ncbi:MAG: hypothetical protein V3S04_02905 [Candidatus Omnitrophota bacterium]